jgi:succinate dehydrogenase/fumarate reductase flavoprotein subunit
VLATGGHGRVYFSCTGAHACTVMATPWCCAADYRSKTWNLPNSTDRQIYGSGGLITEGARGQGG